MHGGLTNSIDPDQTEPSLICVCTDCIYHVVNIIKECTKFEGNYCIYTKYSKSLNPCYTSP